MRIAAGIEYDGRPYCGWQYQDHSPSVQAKVEKAFSHVANHELRVVCAGRTDTGVHATGQVIHFDTDAQRSDYSWLRGSNTNLPPSVSVQWIKQVDDEFHARFSATQRAYRYVICNRPGRSAVFNGLVTWNHLPLQLERMQVAAKHFLGEHDFSSFRASGCQAKSPVRTIHKLELTQQGEFIVIDIEANAFLHHMVRNIAGVLMAIGCGDAEPGWAKEVLEHRDRKLGGVTASPSGLYLTRVGYPEHFAIPQAVVKLFI